MLGDPLEELSRATGGFSSAGINKSSQKRWTRKSQKNDVTIEQRRTADMGQGRGFCWVAFFLDRTTTWMPNRTLHQAKLNFQHR